ncbi:DNA glycosylase [Xylariomycetidae sp. FL0641]|nr:DNA glycosylase [Xylariomycetidae sp. FL0641]
MAKTRSQKAPAVPVRGGWDQLPHNMGAAPTAASTPAALPVPKAKDSEDAQSIEPSKTNSTGAQVRNTRSSARVAALAASAPNTLKDAQPSERVTAKSTVSKARDTPASGAIESTAPKAEKPNDVQTPTDVGQKVRNTTGEARETRAASARRAASVVNAVLNPANTQSAELGEAESTDSKLHGSQASGTIESAASKAEVFNDVQATEPAENDAIGVQVHDTRRITRAASARHAALVAATRNSGSQPTEAEEALKKGKEAAKVKRSDETGDNEDSDPKNKKRKRAVKAAKSDDDDEDFEFDPENAPEQKKRRRKARRTKDNPYGLTPGETPFPDWEAPSAEQCEVVYRLLADMHDDVQPQAPEIIPAPSLEVTGCGEVPSVLDALIRTLLSGATTFASAAKMLQGLTEKFGVLEEGIGKGSIDWNKVRLATLDDVIAAIRVGGLSGIKAKHIKAILDMVHEENEERRAAYLEEEKTGVRANVIGASRKTGGQKQLEILKAEQAIPSLDHMRDLTADEAMKEFVKYPGVGVKTAACVVLFCLQRPCFAVDTHVDKFAKWLRWAPEKANEDDVFSHLEVRCPNHLKYGLHQLFIRHGQTCGKCRRHTVEGTDDWAKIVCPLEHLLERFDKRQSKAAPKPPKKSKVKKEKEEEEGEVKKEEEQEDKDEATTGQLQAGGPAVKQEEIQEAVREDEAEEDVIA